MSTVTKAMKTQVEPHTLLARLLGGIPVEDNVAVDAYPDEWAAIVQAVQSADRDHRLHAFEEALENRVDADIIRAAVFAASPTGETEAASTYDGSEEFHWLPQVEIPELPHSAKLPASLEREAAQVGNWLNDYLEFARKAYPMTPAEFHEAFGLNTLSAVTARRVVLRMPEAKIFPNLFSLIIAPSTLYRKTSGSKLAERQLECAGLRVLLLPTRLSPESLLQELTGQKPRDFDSWLEADKEDWQNERRFAAQRFWFLEEVSFLFESFALKHNAALLPALLELSDCPEQKVVFTLGRGRHTVRRAYLTVCGITTPAALRPHLNKREYWEDGLWARFALITPSSLPPWRFWPREENSSESLTTNLKTLAWEKLPVPKLNEAGEYEPVESLSVVLHKEVWPRWEAYAHALERELLLSKVVPEKLFSTYGRFATQAMKVAILLATADWALASNAAAPMVFPTHWARAQMIVEGWRASVHRLIAMPDLENSEKDLEPKILYHLEIAPNGFTARELAIRLGQTGTRERGDVDLTLLRMEKDGLLARGQRKGARGPATEVWRKNTCKLVT